MLRETKSERRRNLLDVIAPTAVLRLAAGRVRPRICSGENMVSSRSARTVANLGIASALAVFLGACGSMSLPSFSSSRRGGAGAGAGAGNAGDHPRRRDRRPLGPCLVPESQRPRAHRSRREGAMQAALCDRRRRHRRRDHASGRPGDAAGVAPQGQPERQELYRPARSGRRRAGSRDRLLRRHAS